MGPLGQQMWIVHMGHGFSILLPCSLVNKDEYIIYYAYTSVQSVITYDRLGSCFRFVYIYACIAVFLMLLPFLGE